MFVPNLVGSLLISLGSSLSFPESTPACAIDAQAPSSSAASAPAETPDARRERLLASAVCSLAITYPPDALMTELKDVATRVQPAFCVGADGLAITNYSALHGAKEIKARFNGEKRGADVVVLGADPAQDLALVRVKRDVSAKAVPADSAVSGATPPDTAAAFLQLGSDRKLERDPTWTLLPALCGQIARAIPGDELFTRPEGGAGALTRKLGPLDRFVGGAPIVDDDGRVLGLWTWSWPNANGAPAWIDASRLKSLVDRFGTATPLSTADRGKAYGMSVRRSRSFPLLEWPEKASETAAGEAARRAQEFAKEIRCTRSGCLGKGKITEREKKLVGKDYQYVETIVECDKCKGSGLVDARDIWRRARIVSNKAAAAPVTPAAADIVLRGLEEGVTSAAQINPAVFERRLDDSSPEELRPLNLTPGHSVALPLYYWEWTDRKASEWSESTVALWETHLGSLLLVDPRMRRVIEEGYRAFVVGTVAGYVTVGERDVVVLERCYGVPIKAIGDKPGR